MNSSNYEQVLKALESKSAYLSKFPDLLKKAKEGFKVTVTRDLVSDSFELYSDDKGTFVPGKFSSIVFNGKFKATEGATELFTHDKVEPEETLLTCEEDFSDLKVSNIPQCMGVGMVAMAEELREVYDDIVSAKGKDLSYEDFLPENISPLLGELPNVDFVVKPTDGRTSEVKPVKFHRTMINKILDATVQTDEKVLVIGGDGGSASKRYRKYILDCMFFDDKSCKHAQKLRKRFGLRGDDFVISNIRDYDWKLVKLNYKVVMFNFQCGQRIINAMRDALINTDILTFGLVCDPIFDGNSDFKLFEDELAFDEEVRTCAVPDNVDYKVLAVSNTRVAVYTDHGVFIDDRWQVSPEFASINRRDIAAIMNIGYSYDGMEHGSLKILRNYNVFLKSLNYQIDIDNIEEYEEKVQMMQVIDKKMYKMSGEEVSPWVDLPNSQVLLYLCDRDRKFKFLDINIKGDYWYRRYVLSLSVALSIGTGLYFSPHRSFNDPPNIWLDKMVEFYHYVVDNEVHEMYSHDDLGEFLVNKPLIKLPTLQIKGLYYSSPLQRWCYDEEEFLKYLPMKGVNFKDSGIDMEVVLGDYEVNLEATYPLWALIPITRSLALRKLDKANLKIGVNYVRLYDYERIKYPDAVYCAGWVDDVISSHVQSVDFVDPGGLNIIAGFEDVSDVVPCTLEELEIDMDFFGEMNF